MISNQKIVGIKITESKADDGAPKIFLDCVLVGRKGDLGLRSCHGKKASKITKRSKYLDDSNFAVELLLKIISNMEGLPKNLQPSYVNLWKTARAYGKCLRCVNCKDDAEALKLNMLCVVKFPISMTLKSEAIITVDTFANMDHHNCMTALKAYKYLNIQMEGKEKLEKIIAPRPRASPQAPFSETNILLDWFLKSLSIEREIRLNCLNF